MEQRIFEFFQTSADITAATADALTPLLAETSQLLVSSLLNERKILVLGNGPTGALGQLFVSTLVNRLQQERPSLPALSLNTDANTMTAIAHDNGMEEIYARQIRALAQAGDVLVIVNGGNEAGSIGLAIENAHDRGVAVVLINDGNGHYASMLHSSDRELRVPTLNSPAILGAYLSILLCLSELIDLQLFGVGD